MCVAIDNGEIIANYSALPITICFNSNEYKCAISLNTMTDPQYAGTGLFTKLAELLYSSLKNKGYSFIYGFPNNVSNRTFVSKLGWKDIYEISTLQYEIEKNVLYDYFDINDIKTGLPMNFSIDIVDSLFVKKSFEYIKWRYLDNAIYKYQYINIDDFNWAIYKYYDEYVNIVELHTISISAFKQLISYIINIAKKSGYKYITIWERINTDKHICLEKMGFINKGPIRYFAAKKLNEFNLPDIYNYDNWSICMGDDNVY